MAEVENTAAAEQTQDNAKPQTADAPAQAVEADATPLNGQDKSGSKPEQSSENTESVKDPKSGDRYAKEDRNGRDRRDDRNGGYRNNRGGRFNKPRQRATFDELPESDDPDEIRKQVEFYFSDANLPQDRYLFEMTRGTKNLSVPIKTICNFKRMRHFQPFSAVVKALKDSEVLEVVNNDEEVKRKKPLDDAFGTEYDPSRVKIYEDESMARSIYAKGFPYEYDSIQAEIEAFFEPYGPVKQVRLRRVDNSGEFKRSVFVEFETEDLAKQFLELDPKPSFRDKEKDEDRELQVMSKKTYVEKKADEIRDGTIRPNEGRSGRGNFRGGRGGRGRGGDRGRGGRGRDDRRGGDRRDRDDSNRDRDDWRGRRDDFQNRNKRQRNDDDEAQDKPEKTDKADESQAQAEENGNGEKKRAREEDASVADADRPAKKQSKDEGVEA